MFYFCNGWQYGDRKNGEEEEEKKKIFFLAALQNKHFDWGVREGEGEGEREQIGDKMASANC